MEMLYWQLKVYELILKKKDEDLFVVEPFDLSNTARSVYDHDEFERIIRVFRRSYFTIEKSKSFSSILTEQFE
jgi:hypothetical protein